MADESKKVLEEKSEENEGIQKEMLPPALPVSLKKKVCTQEHEKKGRESAIKDEVTAKMPPPSETSDIQSDKKLIANDKKDEEKKEKKEKFPEIPYKEPLWSGIPDEPYNLELLKGGCIKSTKYLTNKPYYLFGRLPNCDIVMEHPSISRYHAVIQYKASQTANSDKGFYLYDLDSTHGTFVNKIQIEPRRYYRLRVGYVMKFGGSTRLYILQGPEDIDPEDMEEDNLYAGQPEKNKISGEIGKVMSEEEYEEWKQQKEKKPEEKDEGISWGFGEDAEEEDIINPFASDLEEGMESHVFKDPKKTLRGFFEREGLDLEYQVEETGPGHARVYHCRVKLPVDTASGDPLYAEASVTGKKREAVLACAAEACRLLDINGLLRQSSHESKKHKIKNWEENDYYDSDEDTFLDRTGSIEKKRIKRMNLAKKDKDKAETFETLSSKLKSVEDEIKSLEAKLKQAMQASKAAEESEDSLESYMKSIDNCMDKTSRMQMRRKIFDLKKEKQQLVKLVKISTPASLPELIKLKPSEEETAKEVDKDTKGKEIRTPSAATVNPNKCETYETNSKGPSNIRHEQAVLDKDSSFSVSSQNIKTTTFPSDKLEAGKKDLENKVPKFVMPALPCSKKPKPKQEVVPPESSLSKVLEGLKSSTQLDKNTRKECSSKKHQHAKEERETFQEPVEKKKRKMLPHLPPSPPHTNSTQDVKLLDEDYSDWTPPTDQSGDGRTKLNEKYGY